MARDAGVPPGHCPALLPSTSYWRSPRTVIWIGRWLGGRFPRLGKFGRSVAMLETQVGLDRGGFRGRLGLILFAFTVSPGSARPARPRLAWVPVGVDAGHHRRHALLHPPHVLDAVAQRPARGQSAGGRDRIDRHLAAAARISAPARPKAQHPAHDSRGRARSEVEPSAPSPTQPTPPGGGRAQPNWTGAARSGCTPSMTVEIPHIIDLTGTWRRG